MASHQKRYKDDNSVKGMLSTSICGIKLSNPTVLASGILGITRQSLEKAAANGAGAVTLKSLCTVERRGLSGPNMFVFPGGMLNAVGLPGQGMDNAIKDFEALDNFSVPVIGSIFGSTIDEFGIAAKKMASLKPAMIEANISCPNIDYHEPYYSSIEAVEKITKCVKANSGRIPVTIKLSPNVYNIAELAAAAEKAGCDAITAINTASGMVIDIESGKPILSNKSGGISGPALKPIAVRCVYEIYDKVNVPIIGTGGVTDGKDAIEMIMAGATAIGIGSACYYRGVSAFRQICDEMQEWMRKHKVKGLDEIRGKAHG